MFESTYPSTCPCCMIILWASSLMMRPWNQTWVLWMTAGQRHFVFVCVCVFSLSTGLDKQQRNTWANTQTSAGVDAGREPVSAWRTARLFVVKEEKVPVLREDGCMGLGLPRTFIRWLRFWVRKRRANGLANTSVQKLALGIIKVSRFWLWEKKWSPFLSNFMKNKKKQNKKTSWNSYS